MYLVAPISTRNQFGDLLNEMGLIGEAVEIGTHRGDFAQVIMARWHGSKLHCIDPWSIPPGYEHQAEILKRDLGGADSRIDDFNFTRDRLIEYSHRTNFIKDTAERAVKQFQDGSLDFIYDDGDHREEYVTNNLYQWWPKLKVGGIYAGHDIVCPGEPDGSWGRFVQRAIQGFICQDTPVYLVVEEGGLPWSYYMVKQ